MKEAKVLFVGGYLDRCVLSCIYNTVPFEKRVPHVYSIYNRHEQIPKVDLADLYEVQEVISKGKHYLLATTDGKLPDDAVDTLIEQFELKELT